MLKKISNKLIFSYLALTVILMVIIFIFLGSFIRQIHIDLNKTEISRFNTLIGYELKKLPRGTLPSKQLAETVADLSRLISLRITLIRPDGRVIADSEINDVSTLENHQYRKEIMEAMGSGEGFSLRYSSTLKTDMLYFATYSNGLVIRLARPLQEVEHSLDAMKSLVFNAALFAIIFSIIMIVLISFKITKPFNETLSFASDFAAGNYGRRILNYSSDEIGRLQKALNTMADTIVNTIEDHILEQRKLETTLDSIGDGIAMVDSSKNIIIYNNSFLTMLGISTELEGKQFFEVIRNSILNSRITRCLKSGEKDSFILEMANDRFYESVVTPIKAEKIIQGILVVLHDISEKRRIEKIKTDLVSNVSHELKTPIAIIRGYLETVKENYSNREMAIKYIDRAIENADRQDALIQDIIKLSMIESVREFEKEKIDIRSIIERCLDLLAPKIARREIKPVNIMEADIDYTVTANHFLVEEIFFNIIDNGINYNTDRGTLTISSAVSNGCLNIMISDTGAGIPEEARDRIFERFYRVDRSRSRATGGTGLGLSIVRHAALVLGWDIMVDSHDSGSTFTITVKKTGQHLS